ncbi:MAG: GNAT family N-acetyltransferase [Anaerolineales bacterium]|nr:GNAT family N-acetyltransferase [Anaerolineales bacterium]
MITSEFPLNKDNRIRLARAFGDVRRVDLSIQCVLEAQMGSAQVDDLIHPTAFKIKVGPFAYYAGDFASQGGQHMLAELDTYTLVMPSSPGWLEAFQEMYGKRFVSFERYSFSGEHLSREYLRQLLQQSEWRGQIQPMDLAFAQQLWGREHFVELADFESPEDFARRGIGFYLSSAGEIVAAAYSSLVCSIGIEVSLYVEEEYRRRGIAEALASQLLVWCLDHHARANWDAANRPSCRLAEKLGYRPTGQYQAYYLVE